MRSGSIWILALSTLLSAVLFVACSHEELTGRGDGVSLALSLKNAGDVPASQTKMTTAITQDGAGASFRGIEQVYIIPFKTGSANPVTASTGRLGNRNVQIQNPTIEQYGLVAKNNSHLYNLVSVPLTTNRVLAYGKAFDSGSVSTREGKHKNGVLTPSGLDNPATPGSISFNLEHILETADLTAVGQTANNLIAKLNGVVETLQKSNNADILAFLDVFAKENEVLACSYQTIYQLQQNLMGSLSIYTGEISEELINALNVALSALEGACNAAGQGFPASYGIPEGSIGIWWNGHKFVKIMDNVNISLVPMTEYCYPPSLWYYANSQVRTTSDDSVVKEYKPANATWNSILEHYTGGGSVTSATRSVAIVDQMQYGVGLVEFHFLPPEGSAAGAANCPLTGIIIGDQKDVDYSFAPKSAADSRFTYDNTISGITLGSTTKFVQMLVLPTADQQSVHFAMEFTNDTHSTFQCQQGTVYPGCKFYLAGELKPANGIKPDDNVEIADVFNSDHKTTVYVRAISLASAYNTIPDLRDPQLELGVTAEMDWIQVEPGGIKLPF